MKKEFAGQAKRGREIERKFKRAVTTNNDALREKQKRWYYAKLLNKKDK